MRFVALVVMAAPAVLAQVERLEGAQAPAQSFALQDDGVSLTGNPGGLAFASGLELDFLHNGFSRPGIEGHTEALLVSAGAGPLTLGFSEEWLHRNDLSRRRTSWAGALRLGVLGVGTVYRTRQGSYSSWDVGALLRPASWFSLGAAALALDEPANGAATVPRRWALALGLRPSGSRIELAADLRWNQCTAGVTYCGTDHYDIFFTADATLVRGLHLIGQFGQFQTGYPYSQRFGLIGLAVDLAHLGVTWGPHFEESQPTQADWRIRLSSERWPSLRLPFGRAALINLKKALERPKPGVWSLLFGGSAPDPLQQTLAAFRRLARDPTVKAVVLRSGGLPFGMGKAEELRAGIEDLRAAGKKVLFYLESGGDLEYSVASAADRIYSAPQAVLLVNGFAATALFAAAGLEKLGVKAEFFRVGAYKDAPDLFTRSGMSREQREVENSLLDDVYGRYLKRISEQRHLDEGKLKGLLDKGILSPPEAQAAGLVDGLLYPDQLEEEVGKVLGRNVAMESTSVEPPDEREPRWGPRPKVAVIRVEGEIALGEGGRDPFGAVKVAGSDSISRRIHAAADDPRVLAIVVRIDSPGGDGNASDLIWRELVRARKEKKKPVIASMGDVAASGGYLVAAGADEILAEPSSITGSIGVFVPHFDASDLFAKLGLHFVTVKRGASADLFNPDRGLTDAERRTLQTWVEGFYDEFLDRVAVGRKMSKPEVDAVGRGRVWTGAQALGLRLIDRIGSLDDAIDEARLRSGAYDVEIEDQSAVQVELGDVAGVSTRLPPGLGTRALRALHLLGEPGTLRAVLPCDLEMN